VERDYFERHVQPLLGPDVEWVGEAHGQQKLDLFARARCLLFPIRWEEPFGMVMVEAMACGTPVVATARGSVPEVVVDGRTGFVVERMDELVSAIGRVDEIAPEACRRWAKERFDASVMVAGYERCYREAIELVGAHAPGSATA